MEKIYFGGCDVGSATGKALIISDEQIVSFAITPSTAHPDITAKRVMQEAIQKAGLNAITDCRYIISTGYGRQKISFANENISEITCHAKGAFWMLSTVRTVVDIGGQDCKVISLNPKGKVIDFIMNDKCAAGTGRFFEGMARVLGCRLEDLSSMALQAQKPAVITSQCSVFAESEVITLINEGENIANIAAGINKSIADRLKSMIMRVGLVEDIALSGGCAKNQGLVISLQAELGVNVKQLSQDPQIAGALGAALIARERCIGKLNLY